MLTTQNIKLSGTIPLDAKGKRLDLVLAKLFPSYSRENLKQWILNGYCQINNKILPPKMKVQGGEIVNISTTITTKNQNWQAENLPLNIIYEDEDILVLNKPSKMVMHPAIGNWHGTLLNALLNHYENLKFLPRAGIVHRLDQDTTGLVIVAKNLISYHNLINQIKDRAITKIYEAIVVGELISGGTINAPIGRDQHNRLKLNVTDSGKSAITHYRILTKFKKFTHLKIQIETGRTHQIRVHMKHIGYPIVGDRLYSKYSSNFPRQALHAKELYFKHPKNNNELLFTTELPEDLQNLLRSLKQQSNLL